MINGEVIIVKEFGGISMRNDIINGIIGLAVGDALGVPVEFRRRQELKESPVVDMREYGTHNQPKGTWSDDTSLTLCLMDSLISGYNPWNIADKFISWLNKRLWTPYGQVFDVGNTTRNAIRYMQYDIEPADCGGRQLKDNGNGSLMRILPLAYYLLDKEENIRYKTIYDVSAMTHGHSISKIACVIYIELAIQILKGNSIEDSYKQMCKNITEHYEYLEPILIEPFSRILNGNIEQLVEDEIKSTGYVVDTLEASIWCLLTTSSYKECVLKAVNLGDDTDTTGAVVGGLAGLVYGIDSIPNEWIECLARKDDIVDLCNRFSDSIKEGDK